MDYCIQRLCNENKLIFNRVIDNYPNKLGYLLRPFKYKIESYDYDNNKKLIPPIMYTKLIKNAFNNKIMSKTPSK